MEERKAAIIKKMEEGKILESFGQKTFVTVTPCPAIGMCKWSIVEMNTKGANHADFYMDMEDMRQLVEDIDNKSAYTRFAADKDAKYPEAYTYVAGENGCKRLAIGGGQKGIRITISIKEGDNKDFKMAVAPFKEIREMCFLFKLVNGLIPVSNQSYYDNLYWTYKAGETNRNKAFKNAQKKEEKPAKTPKTDFVEISAEPVAEPVKKEEKEEIVKPQTNNEPVLQEFRMRVTTPLTPMAGEKAALKGVTEDNQTLAVVFGTNLTKDVSVWKTFETKGSKAGSIIRIRGVLMKDRVLADAILA